MSAVQTIGDLWPVFLSLLGLVIWVVRLESRVNQTVKDIEKQDDRIEAQSKKHDALSDKVVEEFSEVRESLARIEGALGVRKKGD